MLLTKYCRTCALADHGSSVCNLTRLPISLDSDYCSHYTEELVQCSLCHRPMVKARIILPKENGEVISLCDNCTAQLGTCNTCTQFRQCDLHNPNIKPDLPIQVVQQIQTPQGIMQATVTNPDRQAAICPSCKCWDENFGGCCKNENEYMTCGNYQSFI